MGYSMFQLGEHVRIRAERKAAALAGLRALIGQETIHVAAGDHFAFVDAARFAAARTLEDALFAWRWSPEWDDPDSPEPDIVSLGFEGESAGDDDLLFRALAPYVEAGSWIAMAGEDGALWRWFFDGAGVVKQPGSLVWDESVSLPMQPPGYTHFRSRLRGAR